MDSGNKVITFIPPFEIFPTKLSHRPNPDRVITKAVGIASTAHHFKLLCKLTTCMFKSPLQSLAHMQYLPSRIQSLLGENMSCNILQKNNKFLTHGTLIPIEGINETTLDTNISVTINKNKENITVHELLLRTAWCTQVEKTKTPGKIIIITTKSQLPMACRWLDDNLPKLFSTYLPKTQLHPIPSCPTKQDRQNRNYGSSQLICGCPETKISTH